MLEHSNWDWMCLMHLILFSINAFASVRSIELELKFNLIFYSDQWKLITFSAFLSQRKYIFLNIFNVDSLYNRTNKKYTVYGIQHVSTIKKTIIYNIICQYTARKKNDFSNRAINYEKKNKFFPVLMFIFYIGIVKYEQKQEKYNNWIYRQENMMRKDWNKSNVDILIHNLNSICFR